MIALGSCEKKKTNIIPKADLIIYNANIITVNDRFDIAHVMAIKDGKILFVGDEKNIDQWKGAYTQGIDPSTTYALPCRINIRLAKMSDEICSSLCRNQ